MDGDCKNNNSHLKNSWNRLTRDSVPYASHYCEENTYRLIEVLYSEYALPDDNIFAVFVSNKRKAVPVWMQRLGGKGGQDPVLWDYHVIALMLDTAGKWWMWDYDTTLAYPSPAEDYVMESFRPDMQIGEAYRQWFRVIPGRTYLARFSSDRSHMVTSGVPLPPWPIIQSPLAATVMQLPFYWNMAPEDEESKEVGASVPECYGSVMDIKQFMGLISND
ncbi:putative DREV methyltransferase [Trypanosoma rangeli]|uniref:Protein N-terminal glutamine amidohydrolase n=1 Tax=Trypanosoma rangeli TaxID=5698 RepID=A0A3R7RL29_TRYRA|nr:putative DREV methyltransferase [Trypanosoma rangeli]RNF06307.1 putative DREV methyltransferase [Trypanosoma rangeli]|eukprot:RNF06307.1 putative DREV methyltransferase [Trypanosoma rangeli]